MPASVSNYPAFPTGPLPGIAIPGQTRRGSRTSRKLPTEGRLPTAVIPPPRRKPGDPAPGPGGPGIPSDPLSAGPWIAGYFGRNLLGNPLDFGSQITEGIAGIVSLFRQLFMPSFWLRVILFFWSLGAIIGGLVMFFVG